MMTARINTILVLGAGGGIGEGVARRLHALGKQVIVTGRAADQPELARLQRDIPDIECRVWDLTQLDQIPAHVDSILADFPQLDSVFVNAGIQNHYLIFDQAPDTQEIIREFNTNLIAPILVAHHFAPHLLRLAQSGVETNLFLTSSSLAYFPVAFYPIYCPSKAGIASFAKVLRGQLEYTGCRKMNVVEVVPPYVDTPLNAAHRAQTDALQGGSEKAVQPMPLDDYIKQFFAALEDTALDGSFRNEVGVGFGAQGAKVWNEGFDKLLNGSGMAQE